ncbi:response regulator transcription factor [Vibrio ziniensis]|uniref:Response regulator transcription factor n=1 Tax=Vibrio ziniensis TaxID=2711221 RepID=A0A6G7CQJ1_9VIBR|nr:response regulator transcription factor [Vibrio ziniensis]QIH44354.1 response regulator transcription factor [Vibrio ziniensis]
MTANTRTALIIDSFPMVQQAMQQMLHTNHNFEKVLLASDAFTAASALRQYDIDLIILDIQLAGFDGLDFLRRMRAKQFAGKILFVSSNEHGMYSNAAKKMGANGYVLKTENTEIIQDAISSVLRGYNVFKHNSDNEFSALSKRETIVYNYLVKGFTNKRISELLSISTKTVSTYKSRILNKCNVDSIIELVQLKESA